MRRASLSAVHPSALAVPLPLACAAVRLPTLGARRVRGAPGQPTLLTQALGGVLVSLSLGLGLTSLPSPVQAQSPAQAPAAATALDFSIAAGTLSQALGQFGAQAGIPITTPPALVEGRQTAGVQGRLTPTQALRQLLDGTGLQAVPGQQGGYVLRVAETGAGSVQALEAVTVTGVVGNNTEGSGSYLAQGAGSAATGLALTLRETPQSVSIMTQQRIEDQSLNDVQAILRQVTGVTVQSSMSDQQSYYVRGFAVENFQYDGMPARYDGGWDGGMSKTDSAIFDRVEVIRGATGLLNGGGNPSATINLVRKQPTRERQFEVQAEVGSWSHRRVQADLSGGLAAEGRVRGRLVTAYQRADSFIDYRDSDRRVVYGALAFDLTPATQLVLGGDWQRNHSRGASYGGIPLFYSDGTQTNDLPRSFNPATRWSYWNQTSHSLFATLEHQFDAGWLVKASASRQSVEDDAFATATASGNPDRRTGAGVAQWACRCESERTSRAFDVQANGPLTFLGRTHELVVGASLMRSERNSPRNAVQGYDFSVPDFFGWDGDTVQPSYVKEGQTDERIRQSGVFGALRLRPTDALSVILGSRLSRWSQTQDDLQPNGSTRRQEITQKNIYTPYAGVVYDLNSAYSVYASYTQIFRPQMGVLDRNESLLDPVTGTNVELGAKAQWLDGRLLASAAVFRVQQDNLAVLDTDYTLPLSNGGSAYRSAKGVKSEGFELEISGQLLPGWQVQAGYTQQRSHDAQGVRVNTTQPEQSFKLWTTYRLPVAEQRLTLGAGVNWQSALVYTASGWSVPTNILGRQAQQPAYALVGVMARYEASPALSFTLNIDNLFDKTYYKGFGAYGAGVVGEPRRVLLAARYRY